MGIAFALAAGFAAITALLVGALLIAVMMQGLAGDADRARQVGWLAFGFLGLQAALWALAGSELGHWQ